MMVIVAISSKITVTSSPMIQCRRVTDSSPVVYWYARRSEECPSLTVNACAVALSSAKESNEVIDMAVKSGRARSLITDRPPNSFVPKLCFANRAFVAAQESSFTHDHKRMISQPALL